MKSTTASSSMERHETTVSSRTTQGERVKSAIQLSVTREHAEILIHTPNEKINKLDRQAFFDLQEHLVFLRTKKDEIKTLLIHSDKPGMFLAGADIDEIKNMTTRDQALQIVNQVQEVFNELAALPQVTLVAIDGTCFGGGLELALACQYRICSDNSATKLGLPEVQLGVLPGAGGTQRLPRTVGLIESLGIITSGAPVDARKALKIGLVSDVVPTEYLLTHARRVLRDKLYLKYHAKENLKSWMMESRLLRPMIFRTARKQIMQKSGGHYPSFLRALDVVEQTFGGEIKVGLKVEADAFADLAITPISKNLIHIFFGTEAMKKERGVSPMEAPNFKPSKLESIGVLGSGIMGGGIAAISAKAGVSVRLKDISHASNLSALKTAKSLFDKDFKRRKIDKSEFQKRLFRVSAGLDWSGFKHLPYIIEAVVENIDIKRKVIAELEGIVSRETIIATNTSSLSVSAIAEGAKHPERILGMHFFNPVPLMPLVEIIRGEKSDPAAIVQAVEFGRQLGKKVIVCKDRPGFLVNRILLPYLMEAPHLRDEGFNIEQIDQSMVHFGMPMGPFRLLDEIGLDTAAKVSDIFAKAYPHLKVTPLLHELVGKGYHGKKNGKGFYNYDEKGKAGGVRSEFHSSPKAEDERTRQLLQDRLILPMVSEALSVLDEGVVATVRDVDLGLVYGIGFPPFRGGLLRWVSEQGERKILDRMNLLHNMTKGRLAIPPSFTARVEAGQKFYHDVNS